MDARDLLFAFFQVSQAQPTNSAFFLLAVHAGAHLVARSYDLWHLTTWAFDRHV